MAKQITISRVVNAPRELVWRAWTDPKWIRQWWGPKGFTSPAFDIDLQAGGEYIGAMRDPDGQDYWSRGFYLEIVEPERLVMSDSFADPQGNPVPASYYGMSSEWPLEMLVTLKLEDEGGKTKLTIAHSGLTGVSEEDLNNMRQGWNESLDKLDELLAGLQGERAAA
jgi:uncharacterized protein YndB with AHSA1/START domain